MALVSVAECKGFRDANGSEHDAELARLLPVVEATLEQMCGRGFGQVAAQIDYFSGGKVWDAPLSDLRLTRPPVRTIASLYDEPSRAYGSSSLVPATWYVLVDPDAGILAFDGYRPRAGLRNLKITL